MLETKTIGELTAAGEIDGSELIEVEQSLSSRKISSDIPRLDTLDVMAVLNPAVDQIRISQGATDHKRMTIADLLVALGITAYAEDVDMSAALYTQTNTSKVQKYAVTTGAGSFDFDLLPWADQEGCRVRITKASAGIGIATIDPDGAETFLGGATGFRLRRQGDFIEYEVIDGIAYVIDSQSSTNDTAALAVATVHALAHGLAVKPRSVLGFLRCTSAELNYSVGDEVPIATLGDSGGRSPNIVVDATNITLLTDGTAIILMNKTTTVQTAITMNNWVFFARYKL